MTSTPPNQIEPIVVIDGDLYSLDGTSSELVVEKGQETSDVVSHISIDDQNNKGLPPQLSKDVKIIVIDSINSGSGRDGDADVYKRFIQPIFKRLRIDHEYIQTESIFSVTDIAKSVTGDQQENDLFVVLMSGDTSIGEFMNGVRESEEEEVEAGTASKRKVYIANVAMGTGNALLATLNIKSLAQSIGNIFTNSAASELAVHTAKFSNCVAQLMLHDSPVTKIAENSIDFVAVFSWAFHSALVADSDTPEMRKLGLKRFQIAARKNLEAEQSYPAQIIDSNTNSPLIEIQRHSYLVFTTLSNFEAQFKISPLADLQNLFMVEVSDATQHDQLMKVMGQAYNNGAHIDDPAVNYKKLDLPLELRIPIKEVKEEQLRFCVDGSTIKLTPNRKEDDFITVSIDKKVYKNWDIRLISSKK